MAVGNVARRLKTGEKLTCRARNRPDVPLLPSLPGLTVAELDVLRDWKAKFESKYFKVGKVVKP